MPSEQRSAESNPAAGASRLLDDVNRRLLSELQADPRISMSALAPAASA